ncbi:MAG: acyl-CoA dehydrogenase [Pseudomonadota bacterium]
MYLTVVLLALWGCIFVGLPLWGWSLIFGATLVGGHFLQASATFMTVGIVLFFAWLILIQLPWSRRQLLTRWGFLYFKKNAPVISRTELEALEAGDVWWEAALFQGNPHWATLLSLPKPTLTADEEHFLSHQVNQLCTMLDDWLIMYRDYDLTEDTWQFLLKEKFFAMAIPKEYGGLGFSAFAQSQVVSKISSRSATAAVVVMVPNSLGPGELLLHYGTDLQKDHYLPRLAQGLEIPCFALTAPEAGSDAGSITDSGVICQGTYEGKHVVGIRLNWNKRYITLAPRASLLGIAFKLHDPDHLLSEKEHLGITLCLIPTHLPGVEIGNRHLPNGARFLNGPTRGYDVFVPLDFIIGGPTMAGQGWRMLMECLSAGRGISLPALGASAAKLAYFSTGAYAAVRHQFKVPIGSFEGVQSTMGQIAGTTYSVEAGRLLTLTALDLGIKPSTVTAMTKYQLSERAREAISGAMDVHAGRAIMLGPKNYLANCNSAIPISITVEGANILTRNLIVFGQGAIRCHPYTQQEIRSAQIADPKAALAAFDYALFGHIGYFMRNFVRCVTHTVTRGYVAKVPELGIPKCYMRGVTRMSVAFAFVSDLTLILFGGSLKRKEQLSARFADILSELYLASACIKYFHDGGRHVEEKPYLIWNLQTALYRIHQNFEALCDNYPIPLVGWIVKHLLFPLGRPFRAPNDHLLVTLSKSMMSRSAPRARLTQEVYFENHLDDPLGCVEIAFQSMLDSTVARAKVREGVKQGMIARDIKLSEQTQSALTQQLISQEEAEQIRMYERAHAAAIHVDEFPPDYFVKGVH